MPRTGPLLLCAALLITSTSAVLLLPGRSSARAEEKPRPPGPVPPAGGPVDDEKALEAVGDMAEAIIDEIIEEGLVSQRTNWDDPLLKDRRIVVTGGINRVVVQEVVEKLLFLGSDHRPISLYIRTNGGWSDDAFAILDAMRAIAAPVDVWAMGSCDSAGALILAGATGRRRILPHGTVMLHMVEEAGDAPYSKERASRTREEAFWRRVAKLPESFFPLVEEKKYYLLPEDVVRLGLADEVYSGGTAPLERK